MAKKSKAPLIITSVIILLVLSGLGVYFGVKQTAVQFTTLSIDSDINFISNAKELEGKFYTITAVAGTGNDRFVGYIDPVKFTNDNPDVNYKTKFPLNIEIEANDETVNYPIINEAPRGDDYRIYDYQVIKAERNTILGVKTNPKDCPFNSVNGAKGYQAYPLADRFCVLKRAIAIEGFIEKPQIKFSSTISLTVNEEKITKTVSNEETSVQFIDSKGVSRAFIQNVGGLTTGDQEPSEGKYVGVYRLDILGDESAGTWHLARKTDYDVHLTERKILEGRLQDKRIQDFDTGFFGLTGSKDIETGLRNIVQPVSSKARSLYYSNEKIHGTQVVNNPDSKDDGIVRVTLDRKLVNPELVMKVQATWLGVLIEVGDPEIQDATCGEFDSGGKSSASVSVTNIADVSGVFEASISGCEPIRQDFSGFTNLGTFGAGETKTIDLDINAGATAGVKRTCTITVRDKSLPSNMDIAKVTCEITEPLFCEPNKLEAIGFCIVKCDSKGKTQEEVACCEDSVPIIDPENPDGYTCTGEKPPKVKEICDDKIDNDLDGLIDKEDSDCLEGGVCKEIFKVGTFTVIPAFNQVREASIGEKVGGGFWSFITGKGIDVPETVPCVGTGGTIAFMVAIIVFLVSLFLIGITITKMLKDSNALSNKGRLNGIGMLIVVLFSLIISVALYVLILNLLWVGIAVSIGIFILSFFINNARAVIGKVK